MTPRRGSASAGAGAGCAEQIRRFDRWAASYELSQLQSVLYGPVQDAVLRYAQLHSPHPGAVLDVGCGTGRLAARLGSAYHHAHVVGVDASTAMIREAVAAPARQGVRFAGSAAEQLPFGDAVFDLVVATLSVSHWSDKAAALAEVSRVMTPDAILVVADVYPAWKSQPAIGLTRRGRTRSHDELPALVAAAGLRVEHTEPIRSVASVAGAVLVAARTPGYARRCPAGYRRTVQYVARAIIIHAGYDVS
jgi:ubiquinone/menaquinone biosynthesis C-methylase UbiE